MPNIQIFAVLNFAALFFRVESIQNQESDVEHLCKAIYDNGEQYMDGTAAITFTDLKIVRGRKF